MNLIVPSGGGFLYAEGMGARVAVLEAGRLRMEAAVSRIADDGRGH